MINGPDVAIVGAGPYGLSLAAYLRRTGVTFRIFGRPMNTWCEHMPDGMLLKSDGFASNLADPASTMTLRHFCESAGVPYHDTDIPVRVETLRAYGLAFQRRLVPEVEQTDVTAVRRVPGGFALELGDGGCASARHVVVAVGLRYFSVIPATLAHLPADLLTHSSAHRSVEGFRGRAVTVVGAGASAIDLAVLLAEAGAEVTLVARRRALRFNDRAEAHRSLATRLRHPRSTIGPGWKASFYAYAPGVFYRLPASMRWPIVRTYFGPAAGWPMLARFAGVPVRLGHEIEHADVRQGRVCLTLRGPSGTSVHVADHVIAATGYQVDLRRLPFLADDTRSAIAAIEHVPVLSPCFEASVPGLYFVGIASKFSFGPVMQFACGAGWTAARLSRHLARAR